MPTRKNEFPRGTDLPSQSPLYWASNKDRLLRQLLIADINASTRRDLIVMFHADGGPAAIQQDDVQYLAEVLHSVSTQTFDLLLQTPGGLVDATDALCSLLGNLGKKYRVIVPGWAKSGGTVLALSGEQIVMGPTSELGPIDPSLGSFSVEFLESLTSERKQQIADLDRNSITSLNIESLFWSATQAKGRMQALARTVLRRGAMKGKSDEEIEETSQILASRERFNSHGATINHAEAQNLNLSVKSLSHSSSLWRKYWLLWNMLDYDAKSMGFDKVFESATVSRVVQYPRSQ